MNFQKIIHFQYIFGRYLRKIRLSTFSWESRQPIHNNFNNISNVAAQTCLHHFTMPCVKSYATVVPDSEALVDSNVFEKVCEETLESLTEFFEELMERKETLKNADVSYSDGVLTVSLGNKLGTYVINRQSPNRQIWLSSPVSGPKRYDFVVNGNYWIYKHDMVPLHRLLQNELSTILGEKVDLSKCLHSKV
ncbi:frataxin, mitochondrial [Anoplophora glabripennis]|uniref:frataxin, mitochondrial n=1 Tax=Anoplophora glabripennis TaxID=217634 RepID=UPI000874CE29|nr:frataxin, mitochondrial [Anoplophora glabripennis]